MQSQDEKLTASVILSLNIVEIYQVLDKKHKLIIKGGLQVLYLQSHQCFILRVKDFNYHLSKEIPFVACPGKGDSGLPSYVFPNVDGYYIMKVVHVNSYEGLSSLESILNNHTNFSYQVEEEETKKGPKEEAKKDDRTKAEVASDIIYKGGEITKAGLIKGAEFLSAGIVKFGDFVNEKWIKTPNKPGADLTESTANKADIANVATGALVTITKAQADGIVLVGQAIGKEVARKVGKGETGQKVQNYEHKGAVVQVGKSTIHVFASLFTGMTEAVSIIGKGVGETTTKIVEKKYGKNAGKTTKAGMETVGNIWEIPKIIPFKIAEAVEKGTAKTQPAQKEGPKEEPQKVVVDKQPQKEFAKKF